MASSQSTHPICPKCGYDQSGAIATWEDQCPMTGQCPECGLGFDWANVLDPNRVELPWYVEHAKSKREMLRRTIPTLWYLLFPNRYWRRLGMESPRSLKGYVIWILLMMLVLHMMSSIALLGSIHGYTLQSNANSTRWMNAAQTKQIRLINQANIIDVGAFDYWRVNIGEAVLHPAVVRSVYAGEISTAAGAFAVINMSISVMWFLLFCMFPTTRARMKLRMVHVARAMVVAGLLPFVVFELGRFVEAMIYAGEYWAPLSNMEMFLGSVFLFMIIWMFLWMQWFWISAVWIGWKVKARWFEMALVATASFFGIVFSAGLLLLLRLIGSMIDSVAAWMWI